MPKEKLVSFKVPKMPKKKLESFKVPKMPKIKGYFSNFRHFSTLGILFRHFKYFLTLGTLMFFALCPIPYTLRADVQSNFYRANTYYSEGKYDKAIGAYKQILNSGFESGSIYYNLANSYFKEGKLGEAILNYEKAMRLIPRDSDLKSNYEYARSLIKGGSVELKTKWYRIASDKISSLFTIGEMAFSLAALFTIILLTVLLTMYIPSIRKYKAGALAVLIIIFILFSIALFQKTSVLGKEGIIINKEADVKFEPFDSAATRFTLYEGSKVTIVLSQKSWYKIERSDRKTGWVKSSDLAAF